MANGASPASETFKEAYCRHFHCAPGNFNRRVLWQCFYRHSLPLAPLLRLLEAPSMMRAMRAVDLIGEARTQKEVNAVVDRYYDFIEHSGGFWVRLLRVRLSGRRVLRLYLRVCQLDELEKVRRAKATAGI